MGGKSRVNGVEQESGFGTWRQTTVPMYQAITALLDATNINKDFALPADGYYQFTVGVVGKKATAGTYHERRYSVSGSRVGGTLTLEASPVEITGGWDNTGIALTITATGGSLRMNIANSSTETVNGRVFVSFGRQDVL